MIDRSHTAALYTNLYMMYLLALMTVFNVGSRFNLSAVLIYSSHRAFWVVRWQKVLLGLEGIGVSPGEICERRIR